MDEIDGAIEPYDITWIFLKDVYFHVIYRMDENNESHLKNSHIHEVANIDELPIYWCFFWFLFLFSNFVISTIW
jgi:hypothetical protein